MAWNIDLPATELFIGPSGNQYPAQWHHLIKNNSSWEFNNLVNEVLAQPILTIDTETTGLVKWKARPLYWSLAWGNKRVTLRADTLMYFNQAFTNPSVQWIFANAKFDAHMLANAGFNIAGHLIDTQVMHALLYEDRRHALKLMASHLLDWTWADFESSFGKMGVQLGKERAALLLEACTHMGPVTEPISATRLAGPEDLIRIAEYFNLPLLIEYASNDAWGTWLVFLELKRQLESQWTHSLFSNKPPFINTMWDYFDKIEKPYTKVLWKMERRGIMVDKKKLEEAKPEAEKSIARIERELVQLTGNPKFNPNSGKDRHAYFIERKKYKPLKMTKGGKSGVKTPSLDAAFMDHYAAEDPVAKLCNEHSKHTKLYGTYLVGLHNLLDPFDRIHTQFNQDIARTGRLSSSEPNLQNIPRPENDHWGLRSAFIAPPGLKIIAADYEQLEMRLLACAAQELDMIDIFLRGWDVHSGNAALMYDVPYEDIVIGKKLMKNAMSTPLEELMQSAEEESPGILTRCNGNLPQYIIDCGTWRGDAKNIGFGQPNSQAEVKPAQNGEPYGHDAYGNPVLPSALGSVSTWGRRSPQCWGASAQGSHSPRLH